MRKTEKTINVVEMASMFGDGDAVWWSSREILPSKAEYRPFTAYMDKWTEWTSSNINLLNTVHRLGGNDQSLRLNKCVGSLKTNPDVILSWNNQLSSTGKTEIHSLSIYYSLLLTPEFDLSLLDEELSTLKIMEDKKSSVYMIVQRHGGLDLQNFDIDIPTVEIALNYGEEWAIKHEHLLETLTSKKKKGIALLHGLPGTGKSMYIRHLISLLSRSKTVIYLPNQLINCITDPGFIPLMAEYAGSILVIEDADEAIRARKNGGGTVDKLLNLSDGILSDFLGTQIICTFNSDISTIDEALLRKGRLILKHKFEKLSIKSAKLLSDKLGFSTEITEDMTLAEIYNQGDTFSDIQNKKQSIGFGQ